MRVDLSSLIKENNLVVFFILILAVFLRFYNFFEIPYTFDELSALNRTTYDSFPELIEKGILNDGHPALIQVFLYYWVRIFSYSEYIVKLPFLLCGLISVWLVFTIGKKWFSETTGILSAAFMATIQFTIMYSQIARPYATGLCFVLLFVYFWTNTVLEKKNNLIHWIGFSVSAALCAYDHYFSLFSAMLVAVSGLLFISRQQMLKYLLFNVLAAILFLPHLKITLHQLSLGGLNWLPVPDISFFSDYFGFIFHYSLFLIAFFILLIITGIYFHFKYQANSLRKSLIIIGIAWFVLPLLTGYLYSIYDKPVLQFSVLIFSVPFLFISAFSFFPALKPRINALLVIALVCFTIPTLIFSRQYYRFFYNQGYGAIAKNQIALLDSVKQPVALIINGYEPIFLQYYSFKYDHKIPCNLYVFDKFNNKQFESYVKRLKTDYLAIAHAGVMPLHYFDMVQEVFPYFVKKAFGSGFEWYVFSKKIGNDHSQFYKDFTSTFDRPAFYWKYNTANICKNPDDTNNTCYQFNDNEEWGPDFKSTLRELNCDRHDLIHISADVLSEDSEATLVFTLQNSKDSVLSWQGVSVKEFPFEKNSWRKIRMVIRLTDVKLENDTVTMHTYVWNKSKKPLFLDNFAVKFEHGNPYIYAMFYDF